MMTDNYSENYDTMKEGTVIKISEEELEEDRKVLEKYAKMFDEFAAKSKREVILDSKLNDYFRDLASNQEDLDPSIQKIVNDNWFEML